MRIVLGVSAGIAAYKAVYLARLLKEDGHQVDVIPTESSLEFVGNATWEAVSGRPVSTSVFEGVEEVRHVRLGQEADLIVVAPATADFLARVRAGMASDLLTTTLLATEAPILLVPAMHTEMWRNAATQDNVAVLRDRGIDVMEPAVGRLTGADSGPGRMPEPDQIRAEVDLLLHQEGGPLAGRRVLITAGGTREPLDPVRYLGNRSSGKQGLALADAARSAGAQVTLIAGSMEQQPGPELACIEVVSVGTTEQMHAAVMSRAEQADALIMSAAVADFRPADYAHTKIKKSDNGASPIITLERNPDILAETVARRNHRGTGPKVIVGFAAETGDEKSDPLELAQLKLQRKGCELLVLNRVGENLVFGLDSTEIHILASDAAQQQLQGFEPDHVIGSKREAAALVIQRLHQLLAT
ncbi:bifunctional phosphopantothenoylcysteine decarboxylase/phosphopantothenate--cysteine ligase CoaBC [Nesterenkonia salmonea]|uniref:Coenzyme A biosynthesis bifunctional protein CoaBC n=1 Tax=Nesterenkonia salmonea TaxID=1804987 RepID=A0A5R9BF65_9MICC|nr:bifunctional phosphopantothenoylcysteine decarboxylase/phosphopantothenate--cysteine ligase CoaBC [Nesterenkonia salmonea]TLP99124.1 bifunctional phosphopantothenoylcysteine decarboxylase/phosphopantothenate--cysteine ligase CoaBC [Nesterenkonia salmonea]